MSAAPVPAPDSRPPRFAVGLTGGIGSGKSTVADLFAERGADIVDTDVIAHRLTGPSGDAMPAVRAAFGESMVDPHGALNRPAMRALVFSDPAARRVLENILHPMIRTECDRLVLQSSGAYPMVVVPLLVETGGWRERVSRVIVVDCEEPEQVRRIVQRSSLSPEQALSILAAQAGREARLAEADDIIFNGAGVARDALAAEVDRLHALYCRLRQAG